MDRTKLELLRRRASEELTKMWEGRESYPTDTIAALRTVLDERGLALSVAERPPAHEPDTAVESAILPIGLADSNFASDVVRSPIPVIVHFTQDSEYDKKMTQTIDKVMSEFSGRAKMGVINIAASPKTVQEFAVTMTPTLLIFSNGHVVDYHRGFCGRLSEAEDRARSRTFRLRPAANHAGGARKGVSRSEIPRPVGPRTVLRHGVCRRLRNSVRQSVARNRLHGRRHSLWIVDRESEHGILACAEVCRDRPHAGPGEVWQNHSRVLLFEVGRSRHRLHVQAIGRPNGGWTRRRPRCIMPKRGNCERRRGSAPIR